MSVESKVKELDRRAKPSHTLLLGLVVGGLLPFKFVAIALVIVGIYIVARHYLK